MAFCLAGAREQNSPGPCPRPTLGGVNDSSRNPRLLMAFQALMMALFPVAIVTLFWQDALGMSMREIFLLQGLFGVSVAALEFPSGYVADRLGYRRTLLLAVCLQVVGWSVYVVANDFAIALLAEIILGAGLALISGCDVALLFESLREAGQERSFRKWDGRRRFFGQSSEAVAALSAGLLYAAWPRLPFVMQVVAWIAAFFVVLRLVEPRRPKPPSGGHMLQMVRMLGRVFGGDRKLAAIVFASTAFGLATFVPVWMLPLYAREAGVPDAWIGPIWAVANFTVAFAALGSDRIITRIGLLPALLGCVVLVGVGYGGMALSFGLFGFVWYFALTFLRGVRSPALLHEEQMRVPSEDRAGYLSLSSLIFRLCFFGMAPFIGAGVDAHGFHPVLLVVGGVMTAATLVAWFALSVTHRGGRGVSWGSEVES